MTWMIAIIYNDEDDDDGGRGRGRGRRRGDDTRIDVSVIYIDISMIDDRRRKRRCCF
jgi:hypothetical protein